MPSPITAAGGLAEQSAYAPLQTNRFMTGLWTNRNPLRDAATPFLYEKFYSAAKFDSMMGGLNSEISPAMTLLRRAGHSVYNSQTFPAVNRFAEFRSFSTKTERIRVMVDCAGEVYDGTGPDTQINIWNKSAGAADSTFTGVGNTLFFGNGVDQKKWVQAEPGWTAETIYAPGAYIVDSNNNLQVAYGGIAVGVTSIQIAANVLTVTLNQADPNLPTNLMSLVGLRLAFADLANATFLNGQAVTIASVPQGKPAYTSNVFTAAFTHADYGPVADTGSIGDGSGESGGTQPTWNTAPGGWTTDGSIQWINKGNSVQNWGIAPPLVAPTAVQAPLPVTYPAWTDNTYYSTCYLIQNAAGYIQKVTTFGMTGSSEPTWNNTAGATTTDGTVTWTSQGIGTYASNAAYAVGRYMVQTATTGAKYFYQAITAGVTAAAPPVFTAPLGSQVIDGGVTWVNVGILQSWSSVTSASIVGNFAAIPVQGGGFVIVGAGQAAAYGTAIALPTGYSSSNLIAWSSPGVGFSGSSTVTEGVFQSTSAGGVVNSSFQGNFGGQAFTASSNWAAAAWSAGAAVTRSSSGGFTYINFTTLAGDLLSICTGSLANGGTVPLPPSGTFTLSDFINIAGMSGSDNPGHILQGVQTCNLAGGTLTTLYTDNDGNTWSGPANIFGVFYQTTGGVTSTTVTGGVAILIPTTPGQELAIVQAYVNQGASFGLPSGYSSSRVLATAAAAGWTASGGNHGHGWSCTLSGLSFTGYYADNSGHTWAMAGNILALAVILNTTTISAAQTVIDSNGAEQQIAVSGLSALIAPTWNTYQGGLTVDNAATWTNSGLTTGARTKPSQWAYCWKSSILKHVSTASPLSAPLTLGANSYAFLQGLGSPDPQVDLIVIGRYAQGGATLLYEDEIPAPPAGQMWQYIDELPDSYLNDLLPLPIAKQNNPPPVGFRPLAYHESRIWGATGNVLSYSIGSEQLGDPNQSFPPSSYFTLQAKIVNAWACTLGLLVFTVSEVYIVEGDGSSTAFTCRVYIPGLGLLNYDAFTVNKTTPYLMDSVKRVMALDPASGLIEPGFPIADQFDAGFDAATAQITWLDGAHGDTALYCGDNLNSWFRMSALSPPESGLVWSPKGTMAAGYRAMKAMEVTPGQRALLLGPASSGPLLQRDETVTTDNGAAFPMFAVIGSIVLAQPGQIADLAFFTLESRKLGTRPSIGVLLGEIDGALDLTRFEMLQRTVQDPPLLPPARTLYNDRFDLMQNQQPVPCRHLQILFQWTAEAAASELLTYAMYGAVQNEMKSQ